ncbi:hypothetical protein JTE90_028118 [Oedothorax gibbosus]|uniref:tRNA-splicing endonuclease subunit Sen34 n=1 Tax=Oedothorax gibbosus TaxID=931172 RepID=A0AAV6VA91_9ARAC|nr:hypothetical protein JTE90_028118 [Oedothorax gibbosus]
MITLHISSGKAFVWNAKDVCTLRGEHRIVGSLIGCYPIKPFQVQTKWLPLQLMPEEVTLLIEKGIAQVVSLPNQVTDADQIKSFYETQDKLCEEQVLLLKENRKKEILEKANKIFEGKKRKLFETLEKKKKAQKRLCETSTNGDQTSTELETQDQTQSGQVSTSLVETNTNLNSVDNPRTSPIQESEEIVLDKEAIIEAELNKVSEVSKDLCLVQLFTESPWKSTPTVVNWKYPSSEQEKLRYAVYKDLWEKKYYITPGSKFGGDFLAYEGDPLKYHALFIVVCKGPLDRFQGSDIVVYGRLGHQVKKTVALASVNAEGNVEYISINWEHKMV